MNQKQSVEQMLVTDRSVDVVIGNFLALMDDSAVAVLPHALRVVVELGVAEALANGAMRLTDLAAEVRANPDSLHRLLRALTGAGFFAEPEDMTFALTELGDRLRSDSPRSVQESLRNMDSCRAWHNGADSIRSGAPVFATLAGAEFFEHKNADATANQAFLRRMRERASRLYPDVVDMVDWQDSATVMDIGGGDGYLLGLVLARAPHVAGILFERPVVTGLVAESGNLGGYAERCRLLSGDFFNSVPPGADTHLLSSVLHDWTDDQVVTMLRNSRRALEPGGRVLIVEMVLREGDSNHPGNWSDLGMMILTGGRERTEAQFTELLCRAGYESPKVSDIVGSPFSLIESR